MIVLDTDVLTFIQRGTGDEWTRVIQRIRPSGETPHVTIISFEEQAKGWLSFLARTKSVVQEVAAYARLRTLLNEFASYMLLDFDRAASEVFERLKRSKVRVGTMDLRIAAVALANRATLISRNLADFRKVPGLTVEDWTVP